MKFETELDAGSAGHFLVDNRVILANVKEVRVSSVAKYVGAHPSEPVVEYLVETTKSMNRSETGEWVPASRAAKTKAELLAKL